SEEATLGLGSAKVGNFLAFNVVRSGRFLDTPELTPIHAIGNNGTVFDHFDFNPSGRDAFHVNILGARNWFQVPNTYDQLGQDQRQRITTFNLAPGYQHTFSSSTLLTGLVPYDLTSPGGKPLQFDQSHNIDEYAFYVQDSIKFGNLTVQAGLRVDHYDGIVADSSAQPRVGFSYLISGTGTVLRASY